ncbi:MAG: hypothetical protein ACRCYY_03525 [Trueperaceae bacterium]
MKRARLIYNGLAGSTRGTLKQLLTAIKRAGYEALYDVTSSEEDLDSVLAKPADLLPHGFDPFKRFRLRSDILKRVGHDIDIIEIFNAHVSKQAKQVSRRARSKVTKQNHGQSNYGQSDYV